MGHRRSRARSAHSGTRHTLGFCDPDARKSLGAPRNVSSSSGPQAAPPNRGAAFFSLSARCVAVDDSRTRASIGTRANAKKRKRENGETKETKNIKKRNCLERRIPRMQASTWLAGREAKEVKASMAFYRAQARAGRCVLRVRLLKPPQTVRAYEFMPVSELFSLSTKA